MLAVALDGLRQLQHLNLNGMHTLLPVIDVLAGFVDFFALVGMLLVVERQLLPQVCGALFGFGNPFGQGFDFALAFEQAMLRLIRRKEGDAGGADHISAARHDAFSGAKGGAFGQGLGQGICRANRSEPIVQRSPDRRIVATDAPSQICRGRPRKRGKIHWRRQRHG